jgi:hypothetical protein
MVCNDDGGVDRQHDQHDYEQGAEQDHLGFSRFGAIQSAAEAIQIFEPGWAASRLPLW